MLVELEEPVESSDHADHADHSPSSDGVFEAAGEVRILVVDDEPAICSVIRQALEARDILIDTVSDPAQVEAALAATSYHLVVLDYVLPGMEPGRALGWIHDRQPDAGVVVVSGYPSVDSALNCLRARTFDYLTKPFDIVRLREAVFRCLAAKGLLRLSKQALREAVGVAIRDRRKALGLTLANMSDRTGVSLGYFSQIELGKNSASIETLYRICLALGIEMSELFEAVHRGER